MLKHYLTGTGRANWSLMVFELYKVSFAVVLVNLQCIYIILHRVMARHLRVYNITITMDMPEIKA